MIAGCGRGDISEYLEASAAHELSLCKYWTGDGLCRLWLDRVENKQKMYKRCVEPQNILRKSYIYRNKANGKGGRLEIFYLIDFEGAKRLKQEAIIHNFY